MIPLGGGALAGLGALITHPYQMKRVASFAAMLMNGALDPRGSGWQLDQSLIAIGSGGWFGRGLGGGHQKYLFLPEAHTDFIFSILAEELGFLGATALLVLLALYLWRAMRAAARASDPFAYLLAGGLALQIGLYALVNLAVATGLAPTTGLPLPFVSYGGSALMANLAAAGVLYRVSATVGEREALARQRFLGRAGEGPDRGRRHGRSRVSRNRRRRGAPSDPARRRSSLRRRPPRVEAQAVPESGFRIRFVQTRGLPRRAWWRWPGAVLTNLIGFVQALVLVALERPSVVLGTGGYVSGPVSLAAVLLRRPLILQEQNSIPGLANRWLARVADEVHLSFTEARAYFARKDNLKVTGNPVRSYILGGDRATAIAEFGLTEGRPTVFVFGGVAGPIASTRPRSRPCGG